MKGLILLFLTIVIFGIGLRYCSADSKALAKKIVRENLFVFLFALVAVAIAVFFSVNTTLRLV